MASKALGCAEEALLWNQGSAFVFGVDEAGRGCLAGPVCAAVAAWEPMRGFDAQVQVRDSKQMTEHAREQAFEPIRELAKSYGVGFASAREVDRWNILRATYLAVARAMEQALSDLVARGVLFAGKLDPSLFSFLTDGSHPLLSHSRQFVYSPEYGAEFPLLQELFREPPKEKCIVKGDSKVYSIASASILAKVSRDRLMLSLDREFPAYEFALHKGYSTARHINNLNKVGPCSEHRMSFSPVAEAAQRMQQ